MSTKKVLYITNISNGVTSFSRANVMVANQVKMNFHIAGNFSGTSLDKLREDEKKYGVKFCQLDLSRSPYSLRNIKAYAQLVDYIKKEQIEYIHCNTPVGGMLGRFAGEKCKVKRVIYQAHGFHFYKGAPFLNNTIYYLFEMLFARYTDALITINKEDFEAAKKMKLRKNGKVYFVHGVGIETSDFQFDINCRIEKRKELGLREADVVLISAGRLEANKNNETTIRALSKVPNVKLLLCGDGELKRDLMQLAKELDVQDRVFFLGNRKDIKELYMASDIMVMMSYREGLSRSIMEAMAIGLPCVVSRIRGNVDLIIDGYNGYLCDVTDDRQCAEAINHLATNGNLRNEMGTHNCIKIREYDSKVVEEEILKIYREILENV